MWHARARASPTETTLSMGLTPAAAAAASAVQEAAIRRQRCQRRCVSNRSWNDIDRDIGSASAHHNMYLTEVWLDGLIYR